MHRYLFVASLILHLFWCLHFHFSTIDSSSEFAGNSTASESSPSTPSPSRRQSSDAPTSTTRKPLTKQRRQTVYDAVARKSAPDRFLNAKKRNPRSGKLGSTRPVPPETILAYRWRQQLQHAKIPDRVDDVSMMQAGLVVPSHRNPALPDSVLSLNEDCG